MTDAGWTTVAPTTQLAVPGLLEVEFDGETVAIARTTEELFAVEGWCTHEDCSLAEGELYDEQIECYCHGAMFDLRTGAVIEGPATEPLSTYDVRELDGELQLRHPVAGTRE